MSLGDVDDRRSRGQMYRAPCQWRHLVHLDQGLGRRWISTLSKARPNNASRYGLIRPFQFDFNATGSVTPISTHIDNTLLPTYSRLPMFFRSPTSYCKHTYLVTRASYDWKLTPSTMRLYTHANPARYSATDDFVDDSEPEREELRKKRKDTTLLQSTAARPPPMTHTSSADKPNTSVIEISGMYGFIRLFLSRILFIE